MIVYGIVLINTTLFHILPLKPILLFIKVDNYQRIVTSVEAHHVFVTKLFQCFDLCPIGYDHIQGTLLLLLHC